VTSSPPAWKPQACTVYSCLDGVLTFGVPCGVLIGMEQRERPGSWCRACEASVHPDVARRQQEADAWAHDRGHL
jgi:hypothetical protein